MSSDNERLDKLETVMVQIVYELDKSRKRYTDLVGVLQAIGEKIRQLDTKVHSHDKLVNEIRELRDFVHQGRVQHSSDRSFQGTTPVYPHTKSVSFAGDMTDISQIINSWSQVDDPTRVNHHNNRPVPTEQPSTVRPPLWSGGNPSSFEQSSLPDGIVHSRPQPYPPIESPHPGSRGQMIAPTNSPSQLDPRSAYHPVEPIPSIPPTGRVPPRPFISPDGLGQSYPRNEAPVQPDRLPHHTNQPISLPQAHFLTEQSSTGHSHQPRLTPVSPLGIVNPTNRPSVIPFSPHTQSDNISHQTPSTPIRISAAPTDQMIPDLRLNQPSQNLHSSQPINRSSVSPSTTESTSSDKASARDSVNDLMKLITSAS